MKEKECIPYAPLLIESMRSLGYSFASAIADLIDNSISAGATNIDLYSEPSDNPFLIIMDNGCGMSSDELFNAMRYGSHGPLEERDKDDLGRFGLGMKSASLSQCRNLTVVSKKEGKLSAASWDLDYVIENEKWLVREYSNAEITNIPYIDKFDVVETGTIIYLRDFDRVKVSTVNIQNTFADLLSKTEKHISLVFHRFISSGLKIAINNRKIKALDPFLIHNLATQNLRKSTINIGSSKINVTSYVLPHISKMTKKDIELLGGKEDIRQNQGFYIYRNKRLIIWGTWFRLKPKDELTRLSRIMVDIPNTLDYIWKIDIRKSTAILPDIIKHELVAYVERSTGASVKVSEFRGKREIPNDGSRTVWERVKLREGYEYKINRDLPQLTILEEMLDDKQLKVLDKALETIESSFPTNALYVDMGKGLCESKFINNDESKLIEELEEDISCISDNKKAILRYCKACMNTLPYCKYESVKSWLKERIDQYE